MNTLPLQVLFHFDSASLKRWTERPGRYRETVEHYHAALKADLFPGTAQPWYNLTGAHAYLQLTDADKPLLPDVIDTLLEHDIAPFAQDGTQVKERGSSHQLHMLDRSEILRVPYTLLVKGDARVLPSQGTSLSQILEAAVQLLHANHQVVSVGFGAGFSFLPAQPVNATFDVAQSLRWPAIVRTRDLYLAGLLGLRNGGAAAEDVVGAFSNNPARHLAFNSAIARTT